MTNISEKRRTWVNNEFGRITRGTNMSNSKKSKLLRKLWKEAKRKFK